MLSGVVVGRITGTAASPLEGANVGFASTAPHGWCAVGVGVGVGAGVGAVIYIYCSYCSYAI